MSPLTLRRYRAERLLREEFEGLRARVIATVRGRLGASGAHLDVRDLEACYSQAWQGLYAAVLDGQAIESPAGWLTLVTYRRAIEELRAGRHVDHGSARHGRGTGEGDARLELPTDGAEEPDLAAGLDDRMRLRHLFEGLRGRLSVREREAASFCYLQGLSRTEAAARMGISEARMRKLMDGPGAGRPGVAGKVGDLAETIRGGGWCEEQGSLMRGLAYGILDPDGERYRLAVSHRGECPACRAYVVSLRGLAAVLPPVLRPWGLGAGVVARAGASAHTGAQIGAHSGAGAQAGAGVGGGVAASGAAGVGGAAGGSWLLAGGPLGAKLAVGCLIALGVGAGCVAITHGPGFPSPSRHRSHSAHKARPWTGTGIHGAGGSSLTVDRLVAGLPGAPGGHASASSTPPLTPTEKAAREFGPERGAAPLDARSSSSSSSSSSGVSATATARSATSVKREFMVAPRSSPAPSSAEAAGSGASSAEREFGIG
jgi:DNA-directed RNA polymerase specialized sigma24 family protein